MLVAWENLVREWTCLPVRPLRPSAGVPHAVHAMSLACTTAYLCTCPVLRGPQLGILLRLHPLDFVTRRLWTRPRVRAPGSSHLEVNSKVHIRTGEVNFSLNSGRISNVLGEAFRTCSLRESTSCFAPFPLPKAVPKLPKARKRCPRAPGKQSTGRKGWQKRPKVNCWSWEEVDGGRTTCKAVAKHLLVEVGKQGFGWNIAKGTITSRRVQRDTLEELGVWRVWTRRRFEVPSHLSTRLVAKYRRRGFLRSERAAEHGGYEQFEGEARYYVNQLR